MSTMQVSRSRKPGIAASPWSSGAAINHFGADLETNVAANHVKKEKSKAPKKWTQGTLASLQEAEMGGGNFLAKSYSMVL